MSRVFEIEKNKGGSETATVKIFIKWDNIIMETVDAIALTVSDRLIHSSDVLRGLISVAGKEAYNKALAHAKDNLTTRLGHGDILIVDVSSTELPCKYIFLVVHPDIFHLMSAYRNILSNAALLNCQSVATPGLGCGRIGITGAISADRAYEVIKDFSHCGNFGTLQVIKFVDIKESIVKQFTNIFENKFGGLSDDYLEEQMTRAERTARGYVKKPEKITDDDCSVCLSPLIEVEDLSQEVCELKCCHQFHFECFKQYMMCSTDRKYCPVCRAYFALPIGSQPEGSTMNIRTIRGLSLEGHPDSINTIEITYWIPDGIQGPNHLRPGIPYYGTRRVAFLPDSPSGQMVLRLLQKAFDCRLIFTVGDSLTTGAKNVAVWNNIHHKTNITGGPERFGYPDPDYLLRVTEELKSAGITEDILDNIE